MICKTIKGRELALRLAQNLELDFLNIEEDCEALFFVFVVEHADMGYDVVSLPWY